MFDSESVRRRRTRRTPIMENEFEEDYLETEDSMSDETDDVSDLEQDYYEEVEPRVLVSKRSDNRAKRNEEIRRFDRTRREKRLEYVEPQEYDEQDDYIEEANTKRQPINPVENADEDNQEVTSRRINVSKRGERSSRFAERSERKNRTVSKNSQDAFYAQLETLKQRTLQMQQLLGEKQDEVDYLEDMLDEAEENNRILQDELEKSRQQTGDYAVDIEEQVNRLSEILGADLEEMEERITEQIENIPSVGGEQMQEISFDTESITDSFTDSFDLASKRMDDTFASISVKLEDIIENQKNLIERGDNKVSEEKLDTIISNQKKILDGQSKTGENESTRDQLNEIFADQQNFISNSMLTQEKKLNSSFNGMESSLEGMKNELSDKIHTEDVKVYRNLQDFIKEQDHREEDNAMLQKKYKALRNREYINMVLTFINIILGVFFLYIIS